MDKGKGLAAEGDLYFDALSVDSEKSADETLGCQVSVLAAGLLLRRERGHPRHPRGSRIQEL